MSDSPSSISIELLLDAAIRENMLDQEKVKHLKQQAKASNESPTRFLAEQSDLTPIQTEALEGLLRPDSIAEGYEVVGLLGYGGIGVVYRARQPALDRMVALKTISADRLGVSSSAVARFRQEARAIAKLKHPNIVTAYDYGRCVGEAGGDRFFLAMELVDGADLDSHVRNRTTLDERSAWRIVQQVASALAHAYESGVVHRDIKPANLLLTQPPAGYPLPPDAPLVKVTDFGLAQLRTNPSAEPSTRLTVSGATMGTPNYMAPEQISDSKVDHRADIYALGATAYHMITGRPPYAGRSLMKVMTAKLTGDNEPLDSLPDEITPPTRELIGRMMAHECDARPPDYAELIERINDVLQEENLGSRIVLAPGLSASFSNSPSMLNAETVMSDSDVPGRQTRRWVLAAGVLAVAAGGLWWSWPRELPTPRWKEGRQLRSIPRELLKTWFATGEWEASVEEDGPFSKSTRFNKKIHAPIAKLPWSELGAPKHFGVAFAVRLGDAQTLDLSFAWPSVGESVVVRVDQQSVVAGRDLGGGLEPSFPAIEAPLKAQDAVELRLERDDHHWMAYRDGVLVGAIRIRREAPPTEVALIATGGASYLSDARIYTLERIK